MGPEDLMQIFYSLEAVLDVKEVPADHKRHYQRILDKIRGHVIKGHKTLVLNAYDLHWCKIACTLLLQAFRDTGDPRPELQATVLKLLAMKGDNMEHTIEEGHRRTS
jgi:hypothetical protein